eukprot:349749-Chlamydomonas_euryale.AAC.6
MGSAGTQAFATCAVGGRASDVPTPFLARHASWHHTYPSPIPSDMPTPALPGTMSFRFPCPCQPHPFAWPCALLSRTHCPAHAFPGSTPRLALCLARPHILPSPRLSRPHASPGPVPCSAAHIA